MAKVLIIIDMQNDFIDGPLGSPEAITAAQLLENYLSNAKYDAICYSLDLHTEDYLDTLEGNCLPIKHCLAGTEGSLVPTSIIEKIRRNDHTVITSVTKNTFGYLDWKECITKAIGVPTDIDIVGLTTDICVISNALILRSVFPEATISVIERCCAGTTPEKNQAALAIMASCHIYII